MRLIVIGKGTRQGYLARVPGKARVQGYGTLASYPCQIGQNDKIYNLDTTFTYPKVSADPQNTSVTSSSVSMSRFEEVLE